MGVRGITRERLRRWTRFGGSSLFATLVDQVVAGVLFVVLDAPLAGSDFVRILVSTFVARVVSVSINFAVNSKRVFAGADWHRSLPRFVLLAMGVLALSTLGVWVLHTRFDVNESVAKVCVDLALFFLNYNVQRRWVFRT